MDNQSYASNARVEKPASRIQQDVEMVKMLTSRVGSARVRVEEHARFLGYIQPPSGGSLGGAAPTPVISNLQDALRELDREIDSLFACLNVFE